MEPNRKEAMDKFIAWKKETGKNSFREYLLSMGPFKEDPAPQLEGRNHDGMKCDEIFVSLYTKESVRAVLGHIKKTCGSYDTMTYIEGLLK